ncbi:thioredoxin-like protein [Mumia flava]|uniref:Thioredoxin-like protein n=1 Tax=Mumia flava TaxID=1348852 RepID=A0A0B2B2W5_9ACTN|nr:thioredoxin domain-containing protein [Mumia flava]PJJ57823.1 thioredoxin-like protein [Mumia flava]
MSDERSDEGFAQRWVYGNPEAALTITEFGDLECPYCGAAAPVLRELVDTSEDQVRLVWRHFPLYTVHPFALTAALAAEAAGRQGAFWPMVEKLFKHQDRLDDASIVEYGRFLELDTSTLVGDAAQQYAEAVRADYADGIALGVHGTPTLFVEDTPYLGKVTLNDLRDELGLSRRGASRARS